MQKMPQFHNYSYHDAVTNPTNVEDLPGEIEAAIIAKFKATPGLQEISGNDLNPIVPFHYIARPLTVTSQSCLRCHSVPERAPLGLIRKYGSRNGFGWKEGEIIGAQVVKVPINDVFREKQQLKQNLLLLIVVVLVALAAVMLFALHFLLVSPLMRFSNVADSASQSPSTVAFPRVGPVEELNRLQRSLERLRVSLLVAMNLANKS